MRASDVLSRVLINNNTVHKEKVELVDISTDNDNDVGVDVYAHDNNLPGTPFDAGAKR